MSNVYKGNFSYKKIKEKKYFIDLITVFFSVLEFICYFLNLKFFILHRTLAIMRAAKKKELRGPLINEVYIDECQDNQIVELALILKLFDRADNVFMAGDIFSCYGLLRGCRLWSRGRWLGGRLSCLSRLRRAYRTVVL